MQDGTATVMVLQALREIAMELRAVHGELDRLSQRLSRSDPPADRSPSRPLAYPRPVSSPQTTRS